MKNPKPKKRMTRKNKQRLEKNEVLNCNRCHHKPLFRKSDLRNTAIGIFLMKKYKSIGIARYVVKNVYYIIETAWVD